MAHHVIPAAESTGKVRIPGGTIDAPFANPAAVLERLHGIVQYGRIVPRCPKREKPRALSAQSLLGRMVGARGSPAAGRI